MAASLRMPPDPIPAVAAAIELERIGTNSRPIRKIVAAALSGPAKLLDAASYFKAVRSPDEALHWLECQPQIHRRWVIVQRRCCSRENEKSPGIMPAGTSGAHLPMCPIIPLD
jgi:hypothetical protein